MKTDSFEKIPDERLFLNNSREELMRWCKKLNYFHYMRARGGHNCEGDSFCVYFTYENLEDLTDKMDRLGITLKPLEDGYISYNPLESYSFDELDKLKITVARFTDLEQPQHTTLFDHKAHIWILNDSFEISVSGTRGNKIYQVTEEDFHVCKLLEKEFDRLGWSSILDDKIKDQIHCISREKYPELYI